MPPYAHAPERTKNGRGGSDPQIPPQTTEASGQASIELPDQRTEGVMIDCNFELFHSKYHVQYKFFIKNDRIFIDFNSLRW